MSTTSTPLRPAPIGLRLMAYVIDAITITLILCVTMGLLWLLLAGLMMAGLSGDESPHSVTSWILSSESLRMLLIACLACIWIGFFVYHWVRHGQTIGMKWCHIMLRTTNQQPITCTQALIRLFSSCFGLSNLLIPFDPQRRAFHDLWADTQMFREPDTHIEHHTH